SRSGSTIAALLARGADKELAPRVSFLLYLVVSLGVAVLGLREVRAAQVEAAPLLAMTAASFVVGYLALLSVFAVLRRGRFRAFSPYRWVVSAVTLLSVLPRRRAASRGPRGRQGEPPRLGYHREVRGRRRLWRS